MINFMVRLRKSVLNAGLASRDFRVEREATRSAREAYTRGTLTKRDAVATKLYTKRTEDKCN